ncbi:MAG TPA: transporter associated domain-containing protein [Gammaproteobacteria bacterium]|nr:transporter associated domain-containing protein [Gammaproteobacteria bacterium]
MSDDDPSTQPAQSRSWFERLGQALAGEPRDREELLTTLREAQERNLFDADALAMLEGVLQVADMQVRDVMVPRSQMVVIEKDAALNEVLPVIIESGHSRFPVIGDSRDEIMGIVLAKDLLRHFAEPDGASFSVREYLRPAPFIPESKRLNMLLKEFRVSRNHMAVVADEYGGVAGLVTIEDVIEQIVGEIEDEHDIDEDNEIVRHTDRRYTVKSLTPVEDFNEYFGTTFSDEEFDTIGGLVVQGFAHMPKRGETTTLGPCRFKVIRADSRRIHLLEVTLDAADTPAS